jgi:hypothetical protein
MSEYDISKLLDTVISRNHMEFNSTRGISFDCLTDITLSAGPQGLKIGKARELQTLNMTNVKVKGTIDLSDIELSGTLNSKIVTNIYDNNLNLLIDAENGKIYGENYGTVYGNSVGNFYGVINSYGNFIGETTSSNISRKLKHLHIDFNQYIYSKLTSKYKPILIDEYFGLLYPSFIEYSDGLYTNNYINNVIFDTNITVNYDNLEIIYDDNNISSNIDISIYNNYRVNIDNLHYNINIDYNDIDLTKLVFNNINNDIMLGNTYLNVISNIDNIYDINHSFNFIITRDNNIFTFIGNINNNILTWNREDIDKSSFCQDVIIEFPINNLDYVGFLGNSDILYLGMLNMTGCENYYNNKGLFGLLIERFYNSKLSTFIKSNTEIISINNIASYVNNNDNSSYGYIDFPVDVNYSIAESGQLLLYGYNPLSNYDNYNNIDTNLTTYMYSHIDTWVRLKNKNSNFNSSDFSVTNNFFNTQFNGATQQEILDKVWYLFDLQNSPNVFNKLSIKSGDSCNLFNDGEAIFLFMGPYNNTILPNKHILQFEYTGFADTNDCLSLCYIDYNDRCDNYCFSIDKEINITIDDIVWNFGDFNFSEYPNCYIFRNTRYTGIIGIYIYKLENGDIVVENTSGKCYLYTQNDNWNECKKPTIFLEVVYALKNNDNYFMDDHQNFQRKIKGYDKYGIRVIDNIYQKLDYNFYQLDNDDLVSYSDNIYSYTDMCINLSNNLNPSSINNYINTKIENLVELNIIYNTKQSYDNWHTITSDILDIPKNSRIYLFYFMRNSLSKVSNTGVYYLSNIKINKIVDTKLDTYNYAWHVIDNQNLKLLELDSLFKDCGALILDNKASTTSYFVIGPISPIYDFRVDMLTTIEFRFKYYFERFIGTSLFNLYRKSITMDISDSNNEFIISNILNNLDNPILSITDVELLCDYYSIPIFNNIYNYDAVYFIFECYKPNIDSRVILGDISFNQVKIASIDLQRLENFTGDKLEISLLPTNNYFNGLKFNYSFMNTFQKPLSLKDNTKLHFNNEYINLTINKLDRQLILLSNIKTPKYTIQNIYGTSDYNSSNQYKNIVCPNNEISNVYCNEYGWKYNENGSRREYSIKKLAINNLAFIEQILDNTKKYIFSFKYDKHIPDDTLYLMYFKDNTYNVLLKIDDNLLDKTFKFILTKISKIRFVSETRNLINTTIYDIELIEIVDILLTDIGESSINVDNISGRLCGISDKRSYELNFPIANNLFRLGQTLLSNCKIMDNYPYSIYNIHSNTKSIYNSLQVNVVKNSIQYLINSTTPINIRKYSPYIIENGLEFKLDSDVNIILKLSIPTDFIGDFSYETNTNTYIVYNDKTYKTKSVFINTSGIISIYISKSGFIKDIRFMYNETYNMELLDISGGYINFKKNGDQYIRVKYNTFNPLDYLTIKLSNNVIDYCVDSILGNLVISPCYELDIIYTQDTLYYISYINGEHHLNMYNEALFEISGGKILLTGDKSIYKYLSQNGVDIFLYKMILDNNIYKTICCRYLPFSLDNYTSEISKYIFLNNTNYLYINYNIANINIEYSVFTLIGKNIIKLDKYNTLLECSNNAYLKIIDNSIYLKKVFDNMNGIYNIEITQYLLDKDTSDKILINSDIWYIEFCDNTRFNSIL